MDGLRVGVTAARRGQALVTALERRGASVLWGPTLAGDHPDDRGAAGDLETLLACRPNWLVASTGVGVRTLVDVADRTGRGEALRELLAGTRLVARGAKAHGAMRALAVEDAGAFVTVMPLRQRSADVVRAIEAWAARGAAVVVGPLSLIPGEHVVTLPDGPAPLDEREFELLAALVRRPGVVVPHEVLAVEAWGSAAPRDAAAVRRQVSRVRRRLGRFAPTVLTVRGLGYRYDPMAGPRPS